MKRFLVLILVVVSLVACKNKHEDMFLSLMASTEFTLSDMARYFTDDFKQFFDGRLNYKIKNVYRFDSGEYVASYYSGGGSYYYIGFIDNPYGMDATMYLYISSKTYIKLSKKEQIYDAVFGELFDEYGKPKNIGYAIPYIYEKDFLNTNVCKIILMAGVIPAFKERLCWIIN